MDKKLWVTYAARESLGLIVMGLALFWSAGRVSWWPGWAALAVMAVWTLEMAAIILRCNPGLLAERLGARKGAKRWDLTIISMLGLVQLARYIVAGLDQRFGWTGSVPLAAQLAALVVCILGYDVLFPWAMASNAFFSQIVRIQPERGQVVVSRGPYRFLRHPSYAGGILYELAVPVLLGSWWAIIPSLIGALLLFLRTSLEDRVLLDELSGYADYARQVRYRLLPRMW